MGQVNDATTFDGKELKTNWPIDSGLTAGTEKQEGRQASLVAEKPSLVPSRNKELL